MAKAFPKTLQQAVVYFSDRDTCLQEMVKFRWPDGVVTCPTCGTEKVHFLPSRRLWECSQKHPKRQFSVKVGTIMEDSPIPLDKWLMGMWLLSNAKNGISSYELGKAIGITQKSAWFMLHRIRLAMHNDSRDKFTGHVEADETFIGGRARNMHADKRERFKGKKGRSTMSKVAVMGLLERHDERGASQVRAKVVPNTRRFALLSEIRHRVEQDGTTTLYTDAHTAYRKNWKWGPSIDFMHKVIDHAEAYAIGNVHTNGLENFWALVKRMLRGTYVSVEPFHLFRYLDEECFRFNTRRLKDHIRFALTAASAPGKRLTFKQLTASDATC
jgi:transposase-like protein